MAEGQVVTVQKAPSSKAKGKCISSRRLLAKLCYFYPQYTLTHARKLPYRDVMLLLKTAERERATQYYNLTQIAAAPHTKGGDLYEQLTQTFREQANG